MVIGVPEIGALAALFAIITGVATAVGNYFVLRAQMKDLRDLVGKMLRKIEDHETRLTKREIICDQFIQKHHQPL